MMNMTALLDERTRTRIFNGKLAATDAVAQLVMHTASSRAPRAPQAAMKNILRMIGHSALLMGTRSRPGTIHFDAYLELNHLGARRVALRLDRNAKGSILMLENEHVQP